MERSKDPPATWIPDPLHANVVQVEDREVYRCTTLSPVLHPRLLFTDPTTTINNIPSCIYSLLSSSLFPSFRGGGEPADEKTEEAAV